MNMLKKLYEVARAVAGLKQQPADVQVEDNGNSFTVYHAPYAFTIAKEQGEEVMTPLGWRWVDGAVYKFTDFNRLYEGYEAIDPVAAYLLLYTAYNR